MARVRFHFADDKKIFRTSLIARWHKKSCNFGEGLHSRPSNRSTSPATEPAGPILPAIRSDRASAQPRHDCQARLESPHREEAPKRLFILMFSDKDHGRHGPARAYNAARPDRTPSSPPFGTQPHARPCSQRRYPEWTHNERLPRQVL